MVCLHIRRTSLRAAPVAAIRLVALRGASIRKVHLLLGGHFQYATARTYALASVLALLATLLIGKPVGLTGRMSRFRQPDGVFNVSAGKHHAGQGTRG